MIWECIRNYIRDFITLNGNCLPSVSLLLFNTPYATRQIIYMRLYETVCLYGKFGSGQVWRNFNADITCYNTGRQLIEPWGEQPHHSSLQHFLPKTLILVFVIYAFVWIVIMQLCNAINAVSWLSGLLARRELWRPRGGGRGHPATPAQNTSPTPRHPGPVHKP